MAEVFAICTTNGVPEARRVQSLFGRTYRGFLLLKSFEPGPNGAEPRYWAHYTDGQVERINPPEGNPRPNPDPAIRTKGLKLPASLQAAPQAPYKPGSLYSGLMRQVVQCDYIRGVETKYSHSFDKTHGILEWPQPRKIGISAADELKFTNTRKFWIIEISAQGVFAAPVSIGTDCLKCASAEEYTPTSQQLQENPSWIVYKNSISLAWAYEFRNAGGKVKRLIDGITMQAIYSQGSPWANFIGWAFNKYGTAASNVLVKAQANGYHTKLYDIAISVAFQSTSCSIALVAPGVAQATKVNHGFAVGDIAVVSGADQPEYNGAHVVDAVPSPDTFRFNVEGSPTTPATGDPKIANSKDDAVLTATASLSQSGRVSFTFQSSLWIPIEGNHTLWRAVDPIFNTDNKSGPVFVYYDGDSKRVFDWSFSRVHVPASITPPIFTSGGTVFWNGHAGGHHWYAGDQEHIINGLCQYPNGFGYTDLVKHSGGHNFSAHTTDTFGFTGATAIAHLPKFEGTSTTSSGGGATLSIEYGNFYSLLESCWFVCGDPPVLITACGRRFSASVSVTYLTKTDSEKTIGRGGSSYGIIMPLDRECFGTVHVQSQQQTEQVNTVSTWIGTHYTETPLAAGGPCPCPASPLSVEMATSFSTSSYGLPPAPPAPTSTNFSSNSRTGQFQFHASQDFSVAVGLTFGPEPFFPVTTEDVSDFTIFNANKTMAQSGLFYMRGGVSHNSPYLSPVGQQTNNVHKLAQPAFQAVGGFAPIAGKQIIGFVGIA